MLKNDDPTLTAGTDGTSQLLQLDEIEFKKLVDQWLNETGALSSIAKKIQHPIYQQIISMGEKAVPWILQELRDRPSYWFTALHKITKESPGPSDKLGDFATVRDAWLSWGKERGLVK